MREIDLAKELGLPVKLVRMMRAEKLGPEDWQKDGAAVLYTDEGVKKIRAALALAGGGGSTSPAAGENDAPAASLEAVVTKIYRSPKIVGIRVGEKDGRLRVKDSAMFRTGMKCPVRLEQEPDLYVLTCRHPRWAGKF